MENWFNLEDGEYGLEIEQELFEEYQMYSDKADDGSEKCYKKAVELARRVGERMSSGESEDMY